MERIERLNFAPLPGSFMITAIIGFLTSVILVYPNSMQWGFAFATVFVLMFAASLISMTHASVGEELQIDEKRKKKKKR